MASGEVDATQQLCPLLSEALARCQRCVKPRSLLHACDSAAQFPTMSDEEDEEVVDPKMAADEKCSKTAKCATMLAAYEACSERIEAKGRGECTGQYMDFVSCVDVCVSGPCVLEEEGRRGMHTRSEFIPFPCLPLCDPQAKNAVFPSSSSRIQARCEAAQL